jgi:hypothetical protein
MRNRPLGSAAAGYEKLGTAVPGKELGNNQVPQGRHLTGLEMPFSY